MTAQPPRKRRRIGLIIGLSVGIPVGVILLLVIGGAILGAVAYGDAEAEMYEFENQMNASVGVMNLQVAVEVYRIQYPTGCPTYGDLVASGAATPDVSSTDPWGYPYVIDCSSGVPTVFSVGPDGMAGTFDDIRG